MTTKDAEQAARIAKWTAYYATKDTDAAKAIAAAQQNARAAAAWWPRIV